jgi:hypothetical protein
MPDIRYVCLSDMHLGEEDSILTAIKPGSRDVDPLKPSPMMEQLVRCLRHLIVQNDQQRKPTLVLAGDIVELALARTDDALMVFERFVELISPPGDDLFDRIFYIPGNHDHHFWELARETQFGQYLTDTHVMGRDIKEPWHTTKIFVEEIPEKHKVRPYLLKRLVEKSAPSLAARIEVAYPNLGLVTADGGRGVVFHHGHFVESMYHLMSTIRASILPGHKMPTTVYDIEADNFAWIDFFWSTLGRSGETGNALETLYESMCDIGSFKTLLTGCAKKLAKERDLPGWGDWMEAKLLERVLHFAADWIYRCERSRLGGVLSEAARQGLHEYVAGPLLGQIKTEYEKDMPRDMTFVFGHTHKPFEEDMDFGTAYPQWVNVYNTGGWVVEGLSPQQLHGGAVILIDEDLNAVSLRVYNEYSDPSRYVVSVREASHPGEAPSSLYLRIKGLVRSSEDPWRALSAEAARSVSERKDNLRKRIEN